MNFLSEEYGGPDYTELTLNGIKIATPVEKYLMASDPIWFYEITNLKHAPDGEANSEYYYDLYYVMRDLNSTEIAMFDLAQSTTGEKCCFKMDYLE